MHLKCNNVLEFYGVDEKGLYKYNCSKCYTKYIKFEKGDHKCQEICFQRQKMIKKSNTEE